MEFHLNLFDGLSPPLEYYDAKSFSLEGQIIEWLNRHFHFEKPLEWPRQMGLGKSKKAPLPFLPPHLWFENIQNYRPNHFAAGGNNTCHERGLCAKRNSHL